MSGHKFKTVSVLTQLSQEPMFRDFEGVFRHARKSMSKSCALLAGAMLLAGCAELRVDEVRPTWTPEVKEVKATVSNIGLATARDVTLEFDGEEEPESPSAHRPVVTLSIPELPAGGKITRIADFAPLAAPENNHLSNIVGIRVTIDPERQIFEFRRNNNLLILPLTAALPDLTVDSIQPNWTSVDKSVTADVSNIGLTDAQDVHVYFDADEDPKSPGGPLRQTVTIQQLAAGASISRTVDFSSLATPTNNNLGNVCGFTVTADPENQIPESDETNNSWSVALPTTQSACQSVCVDFGAPLVSGPEYGGTAGDVPGQVIWGRSGILVSLEEFVRGDGSTTFGEASIVEEMGNRYVGMNNIAFDFNFQGLGDVVGAWIWVVDMGGNENFSVNGDPMPPFASLRSIPTYPTLVGGSHVVSQFLADGTGLVFIQSVDQPIGEVRVGGQELLFIGLCAFKQ